MSFSLRVAVWTSLASSLVLLHVIHRTTNILHPSTLLHAPSAHPLLRASCPLLHTVHPPPCPPAFPQHLLRPHLTPSTLLHPLLLLHPILRPPSGLRLLTHSTFLRPHLFHHPLLPPCLRPLKPSLQAELLLQIAHLLGLVCNVASEWTTEDWK